RARPCHKHASCLNETASRVAGPASIPGPTGTPTTEPRAGGGAVKRFLIDALGLVLLALVLHGCLLAAPAPDLVRRPKSAGKLTRASLVGTWTVQWGPVSATFILAPNGDYTCFWPGAKYVGSWGVGRDGR